MKQSSWRHSRYLLTFHLQNCKVDNRLHDANTHTQGAHCKSLIPPHMMCSQWSSLINSWRGMSGPMNQYIACDLRWIFHSLLSRIIVALQDIASLRVYYIACWHLTALLGVCLKAYLNVCLIAHLGACWRELHLTKLWFRSRAFHRKVFTKLKLLVSGSFGW